ncbi:MAG TPA: NAD(P)/FAD-dependent oxidoreductase [Terriglobia bacterium]|nr:NAD(P)/FAD-dependent oxidoreductase [Terriglobia bacterium]
MSKDQRKQILILGGGFAGLYAAMELEKTLGRDPDVEITLVNRENFFLFTPMLHEVAASDLDITTIVNPVRRMLRRVNFLAGEVERIDLPNKQVDVSHGFDHHGHSLKYDFLVLGLGSVTNFHNLPGLEERALTMKSLGDATTLRNRLIAHLEEADSDCCREKEPLLTFVAGGGFAGVETVAGINDFLRDVLPSYPHLREQLLRVVLVHPGPVILPELDEKLGTYAQEKLAERKVEIRVNTKVVAVSDEGVKLSDGSMIEGKTLIWTAGTSPHPLTQSLPCVKERGRLTTNERLELPDWPGVWALGDCAAVPDLKTGQACPLTAQHALRQGKVVAHNVRAAVRGGDSKRFVFSTIGQLAAIGRRTRRGQYPGRELLGFYRLVALAHHLSQQTSRAREEGACRPGLDAGSPVPKGPRSVPHGASAKHLPDRAGR